MKSAAKKKSVKVDKDLCRIITPEFRVSYPHLFEPQTPKPGDKPKFSVTMMFPKKKKNAAGEEIDTLEGQTVTGEKRTMKEVIRNAKIAEFGPKENWPDGLLSPVTDGDDPKFAGKDGYAGHWIIKATTNENQRPSVVDEEMLPIVEPADIYPGCYARAYVYARVWEYMGKQGVQFILDHVQKLRDGKSFGGKKPVDQVFSPVGGGEDSDSGSDDGDDDDMDFT